MVNVEGIKILDATLRDGGLVNDFFFDDQFVKELYKTNINAGIDYMEFGYRSSKKQFDVNSFGKWKFTSDEDVLNIIDNKNPNMKLSIMVDVGRTDYKEDIDRKKNSPIDLFRVATYIDTMDEAVKMIDFINDLGYETTCNIMAITKCTDEQIIKALELLSKTAVLSVYIVDSFGALYPMQTRRLVKLYQKYLSPFGKEIGIHSHNNQQCAFANTIESKEIGAKWLDVTAYGMGRGAGNCNSEALIAYLNGQKYHVEPILKLVEKYMLPMKEAGIKWGYNTSYMLTGITNQHPRTAIEATKKKNNNFVEQFRFLSYQ